MSSVSGSLIGLTEEELPLSSVFIDFISRWLDDPHFNDEQWADQISERLTNSVGVMKKRARARLERLQSETRAQIAIASVYRWFHDLATGDGKTLEELHKRFRFVGVVGLGRTGGSYLTAELFASLGNDLTSVPAVIAHDGFPNAQPFGNLQTDNTWIETLMSVSEYLAVDFSNFCPIRQQFMSNSPCAVRFSSLLRHRSTGSGDILVAIPHDVAPTTGGLRERNLRGGRLADLVA